MIPIAGNSTTESQTDDPEMTPSIRVDPVRVVVHLLLAIYLSPVIVVVGLIGATSIVVGGAAKVISKLINRPGREELSRPARVAHFHGGNRGPRLACRRARSPR